MLPELPRTSVNYSAATPSLFDGCPYAVPFGSASSMALTVAVFLLLLLFVGFFSVFARRFFAGAHPAPDIRRRRPPPPLSTPSGYPFFGPPGLDPEAVRALPVLTYAAAASAKEVFGCVVCLGEFEEKERVKLIPGCGHVFHPWCIDGWLLLHGSCPICRCSNILGAGAPNRDEIRVNLSEGGSHGESSGEDDQRVKSAGAALGRSRSLSFCDGDKGEGESRVFLRRSCSV